MVYFQTKKSQFGYILDGFVMEDVCVFMDIWSILRLFHTLHVHFVYFVVIWIIFPCVGILFQKNLAPIKILVSNIKSKSIFSTYLQSAI
jgi:hypothetical protein